MLNVGQLHEILEGLDPDAPIVVGIIGGDEYDPAYAEQRVFGGKLSLHLCCYEHPKPWELTIPPTINEDGTATLRYDPHAAPPCPKCGAEQTGQPVTDPDGRLVCGECGHAYEPPAGGS